MREEFQIRKVEIAGDLFHNNVNIPNTTNDTLKKVKMSSFVIWLYHNKNVVK